MTSTGSRSSSSRAESSTGGGSGLSRSASPAPPDRARRAGGRGVDEHADGEADLQRSSSVAPLSGPGHSCPRMNSLHPRSSSYSQSRVGPPGSCAVGHRHPPARAGSRRDLPASRSPPTPGVVFAIRCRRGSSTPEPVPRPVYLTFDISHRGPSRRSSPRRDCR